MSVASWVVIVTSPFAIRPRSARILLTPIPMLRLLAQFGEAVVEPLARCLAASNFESSWPIM